ncbi:MAG: hypothetical protein CVU87_13740 [Firmicutes bacterium HGW-Firmicutes-12]|nr:MAG: hypothetical protein CVU87_13740 [Firmicutes bacterium HGW-Firmicutes-12]
MGGDIFPDELYHDIITDQQHSIFVLLTVDINSDRITLAPFFKLKNSLFPVSSHLLFPPKSWGDKTVGNQINMCRCDGIGRRA